MKQAATHGFFNLFNKDSVRNQFRVAFNIGVAFIKLPFIMNWHNYKQQIWVGKQLSNQR